MIIYLINYFITKMRNCTEVDDCSQKRISCSQEEKCLLIRQKNNIKSIENVMFPNLTYISLSQSKIHSIEGLSRISFPQLTNLYLSNHLLLFRLKQNHSSDKLKEIIMEINNNEHK